MPIRPRRRDVRLPIPDGGGIVGHKLADLALPRITAVGVNQLGPRWRQDPHRHPVYEVHHVRAGRGTLVAGERRWPVGPDDIYLFRPGEDHAGEADPRDPFQVLYLDFELPPRLAAAVDRAVGASPLVRGDPALVAAMRELGDRLAARPPDDDPGLALAALTVLAAIAPRVAAPRGGTPAQRRLADAALRRLELALGTPPTLAAVARALGVSAAHLGDALAASAGRGWPALVAERRARLAQRLLAEEDLPVREVARRLGLSGGRALARLMRRVTGRVPRELR